MTFPGLEMTILKFHDFSRFSMTVRTLYMIVDYPGAAVAMDNELFSHLQLKINK